MIEEELFHRALENPTLADQLAFLNEVCADQPELQERVERLLRSHRRVDSFLHAGATCDQPTAEAPGTVIGPYKLIEQIGEGGMGTVFMAEQTRPVQRKVALKVIKAGMDSRQVIARFEAERQALAVMDHVNIARVFDAGTTENGRPYFVMELVHGVPITKYCDDNHLTPRERLELFVPVCQAIQHAHQKGIIHRDIKPSNVMITLYDGKPVPKVIDFGVAKATEQKLTGRTLFTQYGTMLGTLEYMSPEQAEMSALGVDTRSDIYSLGVLLYELLTGSTPLTHKRMKEAAYGEILRMIKEVEPPKPSTRLSDSGEALASISANRHTEPGKLTKLVKGELDWIVMKTLEKDRRRRYETANGFAQDVQRYLADEPVEACPPTVAYRLNKFLRRHRRGLTAASAFVLLLVAAVVGLSVALVAVNRERRQKESALEAEGKRRRQTRTALDAMSSRIIEEWLEKQSVLLPEQKEYLEQTLRLYEEFAADTGRDEESRFGVARAYWRVGYIRHRLGQRREAEADWEFCRQLYADLVADFSSVTEYRSELARTHTALGNSYGGADQVAKARAHLERGAAIYRSLADEFPDAPRYRDGQAASLNKLGILLKNKNLFEEARKAEEEALVILTRLVEHYPAEPEYQYELGQSYLNLSVLLEIARQPREAAQLVKKAVDTYERLVSLIPTSSVYRDSLAMTRNNLGNALRDEKRHAEAEEMFRLSLITRRELAADFPAVPEYQRGLAITLNNLGILFKNTDRARDAENLYREATTIHRQLAANFPTRSVHQHEAAGAMVNLARMLLARKDFDGARRLLEDGVPYHQAALKFNPDHPDYRNFYRVNRWRMAETLLELNDHAGAATAVEQFLHLAVEPPRDAYTAAGLLAGCARLAAQDERLIADKRKELATTYGDRALVALNEAVDKGAREAAQMATDSSLDPLRPRADFQKLLADWKANNKRNSP